MQYKVFAVLDSKASCYGMPVFFSNDAQAIRAFGDVVSREKSTFGEHPEDYTMYRVGSFDDNSGALTGEVPVFVAKALDFVKDKNK